MKRLFEFTYNLGNKILDINRNNCFKKWSNIISLVILIVSALIVNENKTVFFILLFLCYIIWCLGCADKTLLSVYGFLTTGIAYWFLITLVIFVILLNMGFGEFVFFVISALLWWSYSLMANNKVANVANQILSTTFAVIVLFKDTLISLIPEYELSKELIYGYSCEKTIELIFNIAFTPILVINLIALLLCTLKGYWIEKYNNNKDISEPVSEESSDKQIEEEFYNI